MPGRQLVKRAIPASHATFSPEPAFQECGIWQRRLLTALVVKAVTAPGACIAESMGKTPIAKAFSQMTQPQALELCLTCHAKDLSRANIHRSAHTDAGVACTSCHSIHHSPEPKFLLAKKQPERVCYGRHADIRAQFSMPFKQP